MHHQLEDAEQFGKKLLQNCGQLPENVSVVVFPSFTALHVLKAEWASASPFKLGVQNIHHKPNGAFTGEISGEMAKNAGASYAIIGHSERRAHFHENHEWLLKKVQAALRNELAPVYCVGEMLEDREQGNHESVVQKQLADVLLQLGADEMHQCVVAYEPVWAIGTGKTASPQEADAMHQFIRNTLAEHFGNAIADDTSILYGGSVKPNNAEELFSQPNIDGGLVGGASLQADDFAAIVRAMKG